MRDASTHLYYMHSRGDFYLEVIFVYTFGYVFDILLVFGLAATSH